MKDDGRHLDIVDAKWITEHPADYEAKFVERATTVVAGWAMEKIELEQANGERFRRKLAEQERWNA